jgi:hypothetical protein
MMAVNALACRRSEVRVAGPFDARRVGRLETSLTLFDLSCGGAFVNSMHEQREGATLTIKIDLPSEADILVKAKVIYSRPGGFAVRFVDIAPETAARLERGLRALQNQDG